MYDYADIAFRNKVFHTNPSQSICNTQVHILVAALLRVKKVYIKHALL